MSESELKRKVTATLRRKKIFYLSLQDKFTSGIPDLLLLKDGKYVWIELKDLKGKVTKVQELMHYLIRSNGGKVYVVRTIENLKEILEEEYA